MHPDLLFKTIGITTPQKYHCPYVSIDGIKNIVNFLKNGENNYKIDVLEKIEKNNCVESMEDDDIDPFLDEAIETVIETGEASTSLIQRRFKVNKKGAIKCLKVTV